MDVHEFSLKYGITIRKARRMEKDGALRTGKSSLPIYWTRTRENIRKGKMSALAIALAYRFPSKLQSIMVLTAADKRVIQAHIQKVEIVDTIEPRLPLASYFWTWADGLIRGYEHGQGFIKYLKKIIPDRHVDYYFVAVRMLLICENEMQMKELNSYIRRALMVSIEDPSMGGWWHRENISNGKHKIIYHRPERLEYDL